MLWACEVAGTRLRPTPASSSATRTRFENCSPSFTHKIVNDQRAITDSSIIIHPSPIFRGPDQVFIAPSWARVRGIYIIIIGEGAARDKGSDEAIGIDVEYKFAWPISLGISPLGRIAWRGRRRRRWPGLRHSARAWPMARCSHPLTGLQHQRTFGSY
jgi:hypothetical protein